MCLLLCRAVCCTSVSVSVRELCVHYQMRHRFDAMIRYVIACPLRERRHLSPHSPRPPQASATACWHPSFSCKPLPRHQAANTYRKKATVAAACMHRLPSCPLRASGAVLWQQHHFHQRQEANRQHLGHPWRPALPTLAADRRRRRGAQQVEAAHCRCKLQQGWCAGRAGEGREQRCGVRLGDTQLPNQLDPSPQQVHCLDTGTSDSTPPGICALAPDFVGCRPPPPTCCSCCSCSVVSTPMRLQSPENPASSPISNSSTTPS